MPRSNDESFAIFRNFFLVRLSSSVRFVA
jgi:hypothetical protein